MTEELKDEYQVCYKHPDRKTLLRCNKCGRPICPECAVQTPTGYRCKEGIKDQQKVFDTAEKKDYLICGAIAFVLGLIGAYVFSIITFLPAFVTALLFGTAFGKIICTAVRAASGKRRSDLLNRVIVIAAAVGSAAALAQNIIVNINIMSMGYSGLVSSGLIQIIAVLLYIAVQSFTIASGMGGMVFRR